MAFEPDSEVALDEPLDDAFPPLHDDHCTIELLVDLQVVEVECSGLAQAVGVNVHERQRSLVHPGDDERRAGHATADAEPLTDPLRKGCLAGAQRTAQDNEIASLQP